jgi:hypothetical protein
MKRRVFQCLRDLRWSVEKQKILTFNKTSGEQTVFAQPHGVVPQNRILTISGRSVHNDSDLERSFWDNKAGDQVKLHIGRSNVSMDVVLTLVAAQTVADQKD